ncbi:MAG: hypothetical protein R3A44_36905 [Caldilineaceae bacterium]
MLQAAAEADPDEITVLDAGFHLPEIHLAELERYVVRMAANCTARQNRLPEYKGRGHARNTAADSPAGAQTQGTHHCRQPGATAGPLCIQGTHHSLSHLASIVTVNTKVDEDNPTLR